MAIPIWKDTYVNVPSVTSTSFTISCGGTTIYNGKAYSKSSSGGVDIKVNDICADYLRNQLPSRSHLTYTASGEVVVSFTISAIGTGGTPVSETIQFNYDWSFNRNYNNSQVFSSDPIRKTFGAGQTIFFGFNNAPSTITGTVFNADGTTSAISISRTPSADFNGDFNADFFTSSATMIERGTLCLNMNNYPNAVKVVVQGLQYDLAEGDFRYALHYINAYGGWDSLLMSSGVITDSYTRKTANRLISNATASARGIVNFANTYKQKYTLHTGWLLGTAGEKMYHILGSTCVFLQDIAKSEILPVNITDNSCEYKSYRSNGGKLVDFTINCELAQERKRL